MKVLVTYFSAEGTTAKVAKNLARQIGADIFEIKPAEPYTEADINWKNPLARCNKEKIGRKDVPFAGDVADFDGYDVVFIGFPIWYYSAPNIVGTFIKAHDWSGKKAALFATSGGSDISKVPEKLAPLFEGRGEVVSAKLFRGDVTKEDLKNWAESVMA